jgi:hypothetical protein
VFRGSAWRGLATAPVPDVKVLFGEAFEGVYLLLRFRSRGSSPAVAREGGFLDGVRSGVSRTLRGGELFRAARMACRRVPRAAPGGSLC